MSTGQASIRRGRSPWWAFAALVVALPALVLIVARALPWDLGTPWIQLVSALPYVAVLLLAAILLSLLSRGRAAAVLTVFLAVALLLQLFWVIPRFFPTAADAAGRTAAGIAAPAAAVNGTGGNGGSGPNGGNGGSGPDVGTGGSAASTPTGAGELLVMSLNIGDGEPDISRIVALVRDANVDVLALLELKPATAKALNRAGLKTLLPHKVVDVRWGGTGGGLYSRFPLTDLGKIPGTAFYQPRAALALPWHSKPVWLTAVHVDSPRPGHTSSWRSDLRTLAQSDHPGEPVLLLGDFNASIDHREFRSLLAGGYTDAALAIGRSLWPTWPENATVPPFVAIDHVLANNRFGIQNYWTESVGGTDHAAVLATLTMPADAGS